jgi:deoxyribonuclease V
LQKKLASLVSQESDLPESVRYVAGADAAYSRKRGVGAAVLLDYDTLKPVEVATINARVAFPYVPGLLAFREAPVVVRALRKLGQSPDVCVVDGHGLAHPRRFGLACYVGLVLDLPTIGVAKSRLFGAEVGETLVDPDQKVVGSILRLGKKSLYVSVGHKVSLEDAVAIVRHCVTERGLEPILLADQEARKRRWSLET